MAGPLRRVLSDRVAALALALVGPSFSLTLLLEALPLCESATERELLHGRFLAAVDVAAAAARALHVAGHVLAVQAARLGDFGVGLSFALLHEPVVRYTGGCLLVEEAVRDLVVAWSCPDEARLSASREALRAVLRGTGPDVLRLYESLELAEHVLAFNPPQAHA